MHDRVQPSSRTRSCRSLDLVGDRQGAQFGPSAIQPAMHLPLDELFLLGQTLPVGTSWWHV